MKSLVLFAAVASVVVCIETISTTTQTVRPDAADVIDARADSIDPTPGVYLPEHVSKPHSARGNRAAASTTAQPPRIPRLRALAQTAL